MEITVNGEKIDPKTIDAEADRLRAQYEQYARDNDSEPDDNQLREWSAENVIERTLLEQAASSSSIKIPARNVTEIYEAGQSDFQGMKRKDAEKIIDTQLRVEKMLEKITDDVKAPTDDEIKAFYEENRDTFTIPEQVRAAHIVKHVNDPSAQTSAYLEICNIKERLKNGESFDDLASENSDCPDNAGDLGFFARGQMVQEFEDIAFKMKVGEVSDVFQTQFGYHIVKLTDRHPGGPAPLEEVASHIKEQLAAEKKNTAVENYIDGLKSDAEIVRK